MFYQKPPNLNPTLIHDIVRLGGHPGWFIQVSHDHSHGIAKILGWTVLLSIMGMALVFQLGRHGS